MFIVTPKGKPLIFKYPRELCSEKCMCFAEDGDLAVVPVHKINWKVFCVKDDPGGHPSGALTDLCLNSRGLICFILI